MKKSIYVIFILFVLLTAAAVQADDLSDVLANGVLRMGTAPEYVPFVFYDKSDKMTGIDVALIEEVGRRMGVKVQTIDIAFDGLIDSLKIEQVDIIGRGMSRTETRLQQIDFSRVYYKGQAEFIALASLPKPAKVEYSSFANLKIGVQKATSFEQWIRDNLISGGYVNSKNVYLYANATDLVKGLNRKDVDLIVLDEDIYEELYQSTGNYQVFYDGFLEENYAFGLRKGSTLLDVVNGHLTDMMKDGTAQQIANRFFSINYMDQDEPAIQKPTMAPTAMPVVVVPDQKPAAACINSMSFLSDVTVKDGHQVAPGERFRKTWRVYNNGTCAWNNSYTFVYVSGDRMNGNNINIPVSVSPGQSIDLSVDLTAPTGSGTYKGYWQMRSPQGLNFGETIWVKVRVAGAQPQPVVVPTPTPRDGQYYVPITINSFFPNASQGYPEDCVTVYWYTEGAASAEIIVDGNSVHKWDPASGSRQLCSEISAPGAHQIQLHALNVVTDAWASFTYTTVKHPTGLIVPDNPQPDVNPYANMTEEDLQKLINDYLSQNQ